MTSLARFSLWAALGLWSLGAVRAESPDPAQNAAPPSAASSTAADPAPSAPPAETTPAPAVIPLQIGRHAANAKFCYPFLGTLRAYVQSRTLRVHSRSGAVVDFPVKVFYARSGQFLRAEFAKPHAKIYQNSIETVEAEYRQGSEEVTGLPEKTLPVSLESIFDHLGLSFEETTRFNLTYVMYKTSQEPPKPTLILNIFGLSGGVLSYRFGDEERFRMERIVMDPDGKVQFADNLL
jgi:hypothetical protein